jgi:hypothetical protein
MMQMYVMYVMSQFMVNYMLLLSAPTFQQRQQSLSTSFDGKLH